MATEGKGPIVIPCYLVDGVPYVLEVDANGKLAVRAAEIETLLGGGLPAALDSLALKVKEQSPITGFATSAKQDTMITALQLIDDLRAALLLVGTDRLGVRAAELETLLAGGLPAALDSGALKIKEQSPLTGFATSAKQDTMITALQLIDDLRAALGSVNTDDLQVDVKTMPTTTVQAAGGDKIISLESIITDNTVNDNLSGGSQTHASSDVPTGKAWKITVISFRYTGTPPARLYLLVRRDSADYIFREWQTPVSDRYYETLTELWLPAGSHIEMWMSNATATDQCRLVLLGYQMDAP